MDIITVIGYNRAMRGADSFLHPVHDWQRRYEALRASFVERLPTRVVADRFGYTPNYVRLLRHQFRHGKLDFAEPVPEGTSARRRVTGAMRDQIRQWRGRHLSAGDMVELFSQEGTDISVRTVERVLAEEGFPKLPRRTRLQLGRTIKEAEVPETSAAVTLRELDGERFESAGAGVFLFAPFLAQLHMRQIASRAGLPGTKPIPPLSYLLSFLALKLLGTERYAHVGDHAFDPGLGLFAGLNVLPKCTAMSTYSYSLDDVHLARLQQAFVKAGTKLGLYDGRVLNLDFHTVPHYGDESVLEQHWAGARNKTMKGALTLFAQDAESKLMLYTGADIARAEADHQVLSFLSFWNGVQRGLKPCLVFDSRFATYPKLSQLNAQGVKFITLRRRGKRLVDQVHQLTPWERVHIPHLKRKYPHPMVHESTISLRGYDGELRQLVVRGNGREKPSFMITNDADRPKELVIGDYSRRWRVENGIAESVKFFHLNALSSPILTKVHFDVALTMIADTLYTMLAHKLRGFEHCDAPTLYRHFVRGKARVEVQGRDLLVTYPRRAHNPILRKVPWDSMPQALPGFATGKLILQFQ